MCWPCVLGARLSLLGSYPWHPVQGEGGHVPVPSDGKEGEQGHQHWRSCTVWPAAGETMTVFFHGGAGGGGGCQYSSVLVIVQFHSCLVSYLIRQGNLHHVMWNGTFFECKVCLLALVWHQLTWHQNVVGAKGVTHKWWRVGRISITMTTAHYLVSLWDLLHEER